MTDDKRTETPLTDHAAENFFGSHPAVIALRRKLEAALAEKEREVEKLKADNASLLSLIHDIRKAAGDPNGTIMLDDLPAHVAALRAEREWRPIKTSPKEKVEVLAWSKRHGINAGPLFPYKKPEMPSRKGGWFIPSHWMPLPASPDSRSPTDDKSGCGSETGDSEQQGGEEASDG